MSNSIYGIDLGFGRTKGLSTTRQVELPSVIGDFRKIRYTSGMEGRDIINRLCVSYAGHDFFLGNIAFEQSKARVTMDSNRFMTIEGMSLLFGALTLLSDSENGGTVRLAVGLPVNDFETRKGAYAEALKGAHYIKTLNLSGEPDNFYCFAVQDVIVMPQPCGTIFDAVLDDNGDLVNRELAGKRVAVLDIGRRTVDLALMDALSFIDRQSTSFSDIGIADAYSELTMLLRKKLDGVDIIAEEVESYIKAGTIDYRGKPVNITSEVEQVFRQQATKILSRVKNVWPDLWKIHKIIITGGGGVLLGRYLADAIGSPEQVEVYQAGRATFSNCRGFLKYGIRKWAK